MERYKGSSGTILIIGGSELYTGAPYFAAKAAFKSGAELIYIFTSKHSVIPLKILLPDAIICTFPKNNFEWILDRIHICIFGSGLGRRNKNCKRLINILKKINCPIIIDGDGFHFFHINNLKFDNVIATPNCNEFKYSGNFNMVIYKGYTDFILIGGKRYEINTKHILKKRVAGQGDILCGIIAAKIANKEKENYFAVFKTALIKIRIWGEQAYEKYGEGVTIYDIINLITFLLFSLQ